MALGQLSAFNAVLPRMSDPLIGAVAGFGIAYYITRRDTKWTPFWMACAGAFVALRASALIEQQAQTQQLAPSSGV